MQAASHRDVQPGSEVCCMCAHSDSLFHDSLLQKEGRTDEILSVTHSHSDTFREHCRKNEADPKRRSPGPSSTLTYVILSFTKGVRVAQGITEAIT